MAGSQNRPQRNKNESTIHREHSGLQEIHILKRFHTVYGKQCALYTKCLHGMCVLRKRRVYVAIWVAKQILFHILRTKTTKYAIWLCCMRDTPAEKSCRIQILSKHRNICNFNVFQISQKSESHAFNWMDTHWSLDTWRGGENWPLQSKIPQKFEHRCFHDYPVTI